jgi:hypothetical protein
VLDQLQVMDAFVIKKTISPLALAKLEQKKTKRARSVKDYMSDEAGW